MTPEQLELVRLGAEQGMSVSQIAELSGATRSAVYHHAGRHRIKVRNGHKVKETSIREVIKDMRVSDALEYVLDAYEDLLGYSKHVYELGIKLGLTGQECIVFALLHSRAGTVVRIDALLSALDHARDGEIEGELGLLRILLVRIRKKVKGEFEIRSVSGVGYVLEKPSD